MNGKFIHASVLSIIFCLFFSQSLFAQSKETIYASYKYTLGDSDTKSDAKKIAFIEAKRLCLEKAGSYIESNTEVLNFRLSKDEIKTYTGGILKVEIVSEEFKAIGENLTLFMEVKAEVDLKEVQENLKRVKEDKKFAEKIKEQEKQLQTLEDKIRKLQQQLSGNASGLDLSAFEAKAFDKTAKIRQERKKVFSEIDELEQIKSEIKSKTNLAIENIEIGMTPEEVKKILGNPRSKDCDNYNYGNVWIIFNGGVVGCIIDATSYFWASHCDSYRRKGAIVK